MVFMEIDMLSKMDASTFETSKIALRGNSDQDIPPPPNPPLPSSNIILDAFKGVGTSPLRSIENFGNDEEGAIPITPPGTSIYIDDTKSSERDSTVEVDMPRRPSSIREGVAYPPPKPSRFSLPILSLPSGGESQEQDLNLLVNSFTAISKVIVFVVLLNYLPERSSNGLSKSFSQRLLFDVVTPRILED